MENQEFRRRVSSIFLPLFCYGLLLGFLFLFVEFYWKANLFKFLVDEAVVLLPYLLIYLFLRGWRFPSSAPKFFAVINLSAAALLWLGWSASSLVTWSLLFWSIFFVAKRKMSRSESIYLAISVVLAATTFWELPELYVAGRCDIILHLFFNVAFPCFFSSKILLLPFLPLMLKGWRVNKLSIVALILYVVYDLLYVFFSFRVGDFAVLTRVPTALFCLIFIWGGFRNGRKNEEVD